MSDKELETVRRMAKVFPLRKDLFAAAEHGVHCLRHTTVDPVTTWSAGHVAPVVDILRATIFAKGDHVIETDYIVIGGKEYVRPQGNDDFNKLPRSAQDLFAAVVILDKMT